MTSLKTQKKKRKADRPNRRGLAESKPHTGQWLTCAISCCSKVTLTRDEVEHCTSAYFTWHTYMASKGLFWQGLLSCVCVRRKVKVPCHLGLSIINRSWNCDIANMTFIKSRHVCHISLGWHLHAWKCWPDTLFLVMQHWLYHTSTLQFELFYH